jgi:hypothetical protein
MRAKLGVLVAVAGLLVSTAPVRAHHSFAAEYDASNPVTLKGTVTKIEWTNPHARVYLDVKGSDGALTNWNMELASPNALQRNGWTRRALNVGDEVTVQGSAARDGSKMANARELILASGRKVFARTVDGDALPPERTR